MTAFVAAGARSGWQVTASTLAIDSRAESAYACTLLGPACRCAPAVPGDHPGHVDSSVLPCVEVASITPTVMANASRIGRTAPLEEVVG